MALIPVNFDEVTELKPVVNGRYNLTVAACEKTFTKEGSKPQLKLSVGIDGQDGAPNITHFIGIPSEKDTEKEKLEFKALLLKRNCMLFGVPITNGMDDETLAMSFVGARVSNVEVTQSEPTSTGEVYNRIMVPKLKGEGQPRAAGGGAARPPKS